MDWNGCENRDVAVWAWIVGIWVGSLALNILWWWLATRGIDAGVGGGTIAGMEYHHLELRDILLSNETAVGQLHRDDVPMGVAEGMVQWARGKMPGRRIQFAGDVVAEFTRSEFVRRMKDSLQSQTCYRCGGTTELNWLTWGNALLGYECIECHMERPVLIFKGADYQRMEEGRCPKQPTP